MTLAHTLLILFVILVWGFNFVVAKTGLEVFPPLFMMFLRFGLVALALVWFAPRPRGMWKEIAILSVTLGSLHFSLMFVGLTQVAASIASIAIQLQVPIAAILAAVLFKDYFGWRRGLGMALAFSGIVVVAGAPSVRTDIFYLAMVIGASAVWAVGNIQVKRLKRIDGLALNAWISLLSAPQLLIASLILEEGQIAALVNAGWLEWGAIAYMSVIVTVIGYGIWYYMIGKYATNQTMPFTLLVPLVGVLSGVLVLGEPFSWAIAVGGATTLAGVAIIVLRRPKLAGPEI
ncbi:MAG: DMT family transporter [Alphaproteobacteria bacterium]